MKCLILCHISCKVFELDSPVFRHEESLSIAQPLLGSFQIRRNAVSMTPRQISSIHHGRGKTSLSLSCCMTAVQAPSGAPASLSAEPLNAHVYWTSSWADFDSEHAHLAFVSIPGKLTTGVPRLCRKRFTTHPSIDEQL